MSLTEKIESLLEEEGYIKLESEFGHPLWTRPEWKDWWVYPPGHPLAGERSGDRKHPTDVLLQIILGEEAHERREK